ncbi:helix-turn-helix domain-containing protein [Kocuria sp. M1R5S2]|uniref:AraC family transcriptional regulator n=1 Tax=Kocuria rhizosphaerae TaxID=3376285 RepID=UPI0037950689
MLERVYAVKKIRVAPDAPFSIAQEVRSIEKVGLERARITGAPAGALVEAPDTVRVGRVLGGRLAVTEAACTTRGAVPFLFPARPYTARWGDLDLLTASLEVTALEAHAAGLLGVERFRLRFTGTRPVSPAMARYLATAVSTFARDHLGNEGAMASPLVREEAFRCLATAVLHAFPSTFLDRQSDALTQATVSDGVSRAVAFMEEDLAADIGLAQIAEAARMSPRGLQAAFRRELGTTPTAHLRGLRLEAVRTELLAADPAAGDSVEAVAARWGFVHRGRFAAAYRDRYRENPAATLRA